MIFQKLCYLFAPDNLFLLCAISKINFLAGVWLKVPELFCTCKMGCQRPAIFLNPILIYMTTQKLNPNQKKEQLFEFTKDLFTLDTPTELLSKLDELHYCSIDDSLNDTDTLKENLATVIKLKNWIKDIQPLLEN